MGVQGVGLAVYAFEGVDDVGWQGVQGLVVRQYNTNLKGYANLGSGVWGLGVGVWGVGVQGVGLAAYALEEVDEGGWHHAVEGFGFGSRGSGFGFRVSGSGLRVYALEGVDEGGGRHAVEVRQKALPHTHNRRQETGVLSPNNQRQRRTSHAPKPRKALRGGISKVNCQETLSTFGDKCPQNGSKNDPMAPRTTLECPH